MTEQRLCMKAKPEGLASASPAFLVTWRHQKECSFQLVLHLFICASRVPSRNGEVRTNRVLRPAAAPAKCLFYTPRVIR
jgi:hypothetical protein